MSRIDKLISKAKPKPTLADKLKENNPFLGKSFDELLDCMSIHSKAELKAPNNGTWEKTKFQYALLDAYYRRKHGGDESD